MRAKIIEGGSVMAYTGYKKYLYRLSFPNGLVKETA